MNSSTTSWKGILGLAALALFVIAAAVVMQPAATSPSLSVGGAKRVLRPTPPPPPQLLASAPRVAGTVVRISLTDRSMTLASYRIEQDRPVVISEQTISFTEGTSFVRETPASGGRLNEVAISSADIRVRDTVSITLSPAGAVQKVTVLQQPTRSPQP